MRCRCGHRFVWTAARRVSFEASAEGVSWVLAAGPTAPPSNCRTQIVHNVLPAIGVRSSNLVCGVVGGGVAGGLAAAAFPPVATALVAGYAAPRGSGWEQSMKWGAYGALGGAVIVFVAGGPLVLGLAKAGAVVGGVTGGLRSFGR